MTRFFKLPALRLLSFGSAKAATFGEIDGCEREDLETFYVCG